MTELKMELLYSRQRIAEEIGRLADEISHDYAEREILLVGVLKGAFLFVADLVRELSIPAIVDFVRVASYGSGSQTSGIVEFRYNLEIPIRGRDVIIVEDIIDSGYTLRSLYNKLLNQNPRSLKICSLIDKRARREVAIEADYVGITMEDGFIVGYGLDFDEKYRDLPDIYLAEPPL